MEYVFEFILEFILEGSLAICRSKKINRWIRWPLFIFLILFFASVIIGLFVAGVCMFRSSLPVSLLFLAIGLFLLVGCVITFLKR
ncbi:MAG: hypothetical protein HFE78_02285 [Clostridiales bacterium]|nr:hypothetical protein [Clostridiales bacterium]